MITVWKYTIRIFETQEIGMPRNAQILCAKRQGDNICLWVKLDSRQKELEPRRIAVRGTGEDLGFQEKVYIDTVIMGEFVWHIFEITHKPNTHATE